MPRNIDDAPPPPYSETDIYSNSGDRVPLSPTVPLSPSHHRRGSHGRDNNVPPSSPPSTVDGEIIYTPPLTPRTSSQQSNSFSNYAAPPPLLAESLSGSLDHLTTTSAQAYFETRQAPAHLQNFVPPVFVHSVRVRDGSSPDDFPFPLLNSAESAARDITSQDWQTFVNYLIPNFFAVNNERVIDRKLRAEGLSSPTGSIPGDDGNRTHAEAQLEQIRSPLLGAGTGTSTTPQGPGSGQLSEPRRREVEQTIREWNEGFFGLRGVTIHLANTDTEDVLHVMPGGWDASFNSNTANTAAGAPVPASGDNTNNGNGAGPSRSRFARFMPQFGGGGPSGGGPRGPFGLGIPGVGGGGGPGSFRIGGIAVDGDRVSIGERFVADRNGVRIGSFVADNNGITVNGQPMFGMGPNVGGTRGMCNPGNAPGHPGWGGFGSGRGSCDGNGGPWGRGWGGRGGGRGHHGRGGWGGRHGRGHPHDEDPDHDDEDHARGHHDHRGRRGRSRRREQQNAHGSRSRSSSVSSLSSSSSSGSESSIGSLPDYDELRDAQLPVARDQLMAWLHSPDQPITKERLKEFKQKIKEAKNVSANNNSGVSTTGINEPVNIAYDQKAMRREVKALMKEWKDLKRQQTKLRRQLRKERKQQRRAEKRERRNTRREVKRAEKEQRREQKRANRRNGNGCSSSASSSSVPFPEAADHPHFPFPAGRVPGVPGVPPVPGVPQSHPAFPFGGPGPFGAGSHGGRGGGGGGGIFGPFGLFGGRQPRNNFPFQGDPISSTSIGPRGPQAPGAWPTNHHHHNNNNNNNDDDDGDDTAIHVASQAKYKAADDLEAELIQKETELFKLHEAIALAADADAGSSSLGNPPPASSDASAKNEKQRLAARDLEEEIGDLAKRMALMRTEADAEYARELAGVAD